MICRFISSVSLTASLLLLIGPIAGQAQNYSVTDLSSNDWSYSEAHALNADGQVVGEYEPLGFIYVKAFLYDNGAITDLTHLSGTPYAVAYGINASNQVVGESNTSNGTHAFLYENAKMSDLGTLGGNYLNGYSSAHAINSSTQIVGESTISASQVGTIHAVLYSGASKVDLGALGGDYSSATGINTTGEIVGESDAIDNQGQTNVHAFKYANGLMTDLSTLGGGYSSAKGINDFGVIVGESETVSAGVTNLHAFIYHNGTMTDLGTLGGSTSSASAINSAGQVVGYATDANELANAFLYAGSKMINLNDLIPPGSAFTNLATADAINDAGQIAGSGYRADGTYQAYLLTLTPAVSVTITNPAPNASFQAPATVLIGASASDSDGTVTNVEFLVNGTVLANVSTAPYTATAANLTAGTYALVAIASDNAGLRGTNSINITVSSATGSAVTITQPTFSGNSFSFSFSTQVGATYSGQYTGILGSTNNWTTFTNLLGTGNPVRITDSMPASGSRFYRVVTQ